MKAISEFFSSNSELIYLSVKLLIWIAIVINSLYGITLVAIELLLYVAVFELAEINSKLKSRTESPQQE
jgi:hypothetical protein